MPHVPTSLGASGLLLPALLGAAYFSRCLGQAFFSDQRRSVRALAGVTLALAFYTGGLLVLLYANLLRLPLLLFVFVVSASVAHALAARKSVTPASPEVSGRWATLSALPLFATTA